MSCQEKEQKVMKKNDINFAAVHVSLYKLRKVGTGG